MRKQVHTCHKTCFPGGSASVAMTGELPSRGDIGLIAGELDYRDPFGAANYDLVRYRTYAGRLGLITASATTPYVLNS
jgi:hypothetical protein